MNDNDRQNEESLVTQALLNARRIQMLRQQSDYVPVSELTQFLNFRVLPNYWARREGTSQQNSTQALREAYWEEKTKMMEGNESSSLEVEDLELARLFLSIYEVSKAGIPEDERIRKWLDLKTGDEELATAAALMAAAEYVNEHLDRIPKTDLPSQDPFLSLRAKADDCRIRFIYQSEKVIEARKGLINLAENDIAQMVKKLHQKERKLADLGLAPESSQNQTTDNNLLNKEREAIIKRKSALLGQQKTVYEQMCRLGHELENRQEKAKAPGQINVATEGSKDAKQTSPTAEESRFDIWEPNQEIMQYHSRIKLKEQELAELKQQNISHNSRAPFPYTPQPQVDVDKLRQAMTEVKLQFKLELQKKVAFTLETIVIPAEIAEVDAPSLSDDQISALADNMAKDTVIQSFLTKRFNDRREQVIAALETGLVRNIDKEVLVKQVLTEVFQIDQNVQIVKDAVFEITCGQNLNKLITAASAAASQSSSDTNKHR